MSLDFYLTADTGSEYPPEVFWQNITHNVLPMWRLAGCCDALYESHGLLAGGLVPTLERAAVKMEACPDEFKNMNPENGWGSYEGALKFLQDVLAACREHPKATVRISR